MLRITAGFRAPLMSLCWECDCNENFFVMVVKPRVCFVWRADGEFNRIPLHEFVFANKLPLVINFTRETASSIFESDVKRQVS